MSGGALKARVGWGGICLVVSASHPWPRSYCCLRRVWRGFKGSITRADSPKLQGWGYLTYLFPANPASYLLGELQRCLKDPDWLAQLFIKHVRLERVARGGSGGVGLASGWDCGSALLFHSSCSCLNFTPPRSAGCICMWYTVRINPNQSMWCQNLGTATLRSVAEVPWEKREESS